MWKTESLLIDAQYTCVSGRTLTAKYLSKLKLKKKWHYRLHDWFNDKILSGLLHGNSIFVQWSSKPHWNAIISFRKFVVCSNDYPNLSTVNKPFSPYIYFQAARAKQLWGYSVSHIAQSKRESSYFQVIWVLTLRSSKFLNSLAK